LQIHLDGNLVLIVLTKQQLEHYLPEETEGFVNYTLSLAGVKIGALITEWPDKVKISLRSKPEYDVRSIAQKYGGGGHQQAAGARISHGDLHQIVQTIITDCETYLHSI
jgi:phosphoesterase RecJ-like protein